jgi:general secretion pathway protein D
LEGDFLAQGGAQTVFEKRIDPSGQVLATLRRMGTPATDGAGTVLTVRFKALKAAPTSAVRVLTIAPEGEGGVLVSALPPAALQLTVTP